MTSGDRSVMTLSSHTCSAARENRFFSGIGCADLPYSGSTPESGARCCAAASCVAPIIAVRPAALHRPCRSRSGRSARHAPEGGHRAVSLKNMSRSDTMPMFPSCYVGTGRACGVRPVRDLRESTHPLSLHSLRC